MVERRTTCLVITNLNNRKLDLLEMNDNIKYTCVYAIFNTDFMIDNSLSC